MCVLAVFVLTADGIVLRCSYNVKKCPWDFRFKKLKSVASEKADPESIVLKEKEFLKLPAA